MFTPVLFYFFIVSVRLSLHLPISTASFYFDFHIYLPTSLDVCLLILPPPLSISLPDCFYLLSLCSFLLLQWSRQHTPCIPTFGTVKSIPPTTLHQNLLTRTITLTSLSWKRAPLTLALRCHHPWLIAEEILSLLPRLSSLPNRKIGRPLRCRHCPLETISSSTATTRSSR